MTLCQHIRILLYIVGVCEREGDRSVCEGRVMCVRVKEVCICNLFPRAFALWG